MQNNYITLFLNFHEILKNLKILRGTGKQITAKICDLLAERGIIGDENAREDNRQRNLYSYARRQINYQIMNKVSEFEIHFLQKLSLAKKSIIKSLEFKESLKMTEDWLLDKNIEFRIDIFDLNQILARLSQNYVEHISFIERKWIILSPKMLQQNVNVQEIKKLMLHISFQTYIDNSLIENWQKIMIGLQSKRYK